MRQAWSRRSGQAISVSGKKYRAAIEETAWDGAWYRRAYYDDGTPLGSMGEMECQIDAIAQSCRLERSG
jgi:cellobiose phosphorylase